MKIIKIILLGLLFLPKGAFAQKAKPIDTQRRIKIIENLAYHFYQRKKYPEAIEEYKRLLKIAPRNYKIYYNLGYLYTKKRNYLQAIKEFKKVIKLPAATSLKRDALYNLVVVYGRYLKDKKNAFFYYQKFKELENLGTQKKPLKDTSPKE